MKILVFVAKDTGLSCLRTLLFNFPQDDYTVFYSAPDKDRIKEFLESRKSIKYYDLDIVDPVKHTEEMQFDWLLNLWGGYIFRSDLISRAKHSLNLHPSYLPYGRGRDPVVWAMRDSAPAGTTLHRISEGIDAGPILCQQEVKYAFPIKGEVLYDKVVAASVLLFENMWPHLREGNMSVRDQGEVHLPTRKRKHLLEDRVLSMDDPHTSEIVNKLLAHDFGDYTAILKKDDRSYKVSLNIEEIET